MERNMQFEQIESRSMRHQVLRQLRNAILSGALKPGARLNESEIARQMGVSRGPVREAILALEQEGLATSEHRRGSYVSEVDVQSFSELIDLRILLETHATRIATARCTPEGCSRLQHIIDQMRIASQSGDIEGVVDHDLDFHRTICQLSGNRLLARMWEQLAGRLRLAILLSIEHGYDAAAMVETHPPVLEAMKRDDGDLAAQLLNERTWEAARRIIAILTHEDATADESQ
jgi:DNA-binding GntR family transcriptional regulator